MFGYYGRKMDVMKKGHSARQEVDAKQALFAHIFPEPLGPVKYFVSFRKF